MLVVIGHNLYPGFLDLGRDKEVEWILMKIAGRVACGPVQGSSTDYILQGGPIKYLSSKFAISWQWFSILL